MEGAGKLVEDEELAEAMKERGLGTPATRADTIEGLVNQKYLDRAQRELVPSTKAEQLLQFLTAVKATEITSPAMTGEWEFNLRQMEHGKFPREQFMAEIVKETIGIVERVKGFEEDDSVARVTDIISPTDGKPMKETLRGYKSEDGELMVYKIIGGRRMEEPEVKDLVEKRQVGPLDGFISAKTRNRFFRCAEAGARRRDEEENHHEEVENRFRLRRQSRHRHARRLLVRRSRHEATLRKRQQLHLARAPTARVGNKPSASVVSCASAPIAPEQAIKMVTEGKSELIKGFISKKGRPFDAFIKKEGERIAWEFPPRAPKIGKDGKPIERKPKAKIDLSKAAPCSGRVRCTPAVNSSNSATPTTSASPIRINRQLFKLSKKLCEVEIPVDEVRKLVEEGRSGLIENFVSKRGNKFSAFLVMSQKQDKAEFEFPPR